MFLMTFLVNNVKITKKWIIMLSKLYYTMSDLVIKTVAFYLPIMTRRS